MGNKISGSEEDMKIVDRCKVLIDEKGYASLDTDFIGSWH